MAHSRMCDPHDPLLHRVREVAGRFPESVGVESWGRPTSRAGKRIFAVFGASERHPRAVVLGPDDDERLALSLDSPFFVPPYFGASGWLDLDLTAGPVDWVELHELLDSSFRRTALRCQMVAFDSRTGAPPPPVHAGGAVAATPSPSPNQTPNQTQTQIPIQPTEPP